MKKIINVLINECKTRGFYHTFIMYFSNFISVLRGLRYKIFYFKNIKSSIFFIQSRSKMDIFSNKCRIIIKPFVFIRRNTTIRIDHKGQLILGDKVFINDNCSINCIDKIEIGEYTKIGPGVSINDNDHNFRKTGDGRMLTGEVIIGKNVWIGDKATILPGVTIGDGVIVGANSVVTKDIPHYKIAIGCPAKIINPKS